MGKIRQKNWLLVITIILVVSSVLGLTISMRKSLGFGTCAYDENIYFNGEVVPNYKGQSNCYCSEDGSVKCNADLSSVSYKDFSSSDLSFSSKFLNYLEKKEISSGDINTVTINYEQSILTISIEREVMCGADSLPPVQVGFYKFQDGVLTFTALTNRDASLYSKPCRVDGKFVLNKELELNQDFKLLYQNDLGQLIDLGVCVYGSGLYGDGEIFQSQDGNTCTCEFGRNLCN